jgi:RND family efflux transporter, MFP subunit
MKKKTWIIIGAVIVLLVAAYFIFFFEGKKHLQVNYATVESGRVETSVTATGYVQPVDKVEVGTQVSGVIERIFVDYNSQVTKGQRLAELDKSTLNEKVTQANASLISAQSSLTNAQQNFNRTEQLYNKKAATSAAYDDADNTLVQAKTQVENAKANLHQAKVNLSYADIYSPIDGIVLDRAVEEGQTVAASFSTPTLFTIANDLKNMQVEADVDEADIGQVKLGQNVVFTVDAFPDDEFDGTVNQIRLQPIVTSNVVTYTVIIMAPNPDEKLYPGMTANITILTQVEEGPVVRNEALNFMPDERFIKEMHYTQATPQAGQTGVWMKTASSIEYKPIKLGLSDGVNTIVTEGLTVGDKVIRSVQEVKEPASNGDAVNNPLMPTPPRRRR